MFLLLPPLPISCWQWKVGNLLLVPSITFRTELVYGIAGSKNHSVRNLFYQFVIVLIKTFSLSILYLI
jgi:hypothetical protein